MKTTRVKTVSGLILLPALLAGGVTLDTGAWAEVPTTLTQNGFLTDTQGKPLTRAVSFSFAIYGTPDGNDLVWSEDIAGVQVTDGFYVTTLGLSSPLANVFNTRKDVYLEVSVEGQKMLPRQKISSVPYALVADDAVGNIHPTSITIDGKKVIDETGKWSGDPSGIPGVKSIGTSAPLTGGPITDTGAIGIQRAGASADGYLAKDDFLVLMSKQNRVALPCNDGFCAVAINEDGSLVCMPCGGGGGTVTEVRTGPGLTGGPITSSGQIDLAAAYLDGSAYDARFVNEGQQACISTDMIVDGAVTLAKIGQSGCAAGEIPKWDGAKWACAADQNTVVTVAPGSGLEMAGSSVSLLKTCAAGNVLKWGGASWDCAPDANSGGTVTAVTASAPLTSSGGTAPNIGLSGTVPVANGGTGAATPAGAQANLAVPSTTGAGASGEWGIDISGNAVTVTDGVYVTGSYVDPSWITAISGAKVLGDIAGSAAGFTGALAGDVTGTQGATTVAGIQGTSVSNAAPGDGQVLKYNSTTLKWEPAADFNSGGTITGVTAGTGLTGGGSSGGVTLGADATYLQRRVANPCAGGEAIQGINADGSVACANIVGGGGGTVTQVNTGAGLTGGPITGTGTLSIPNGGVTNAMLANPGVTVAAGTGLSGGGGVALGGTTTLDLAVPVTVANGGTGAGTAAGARTNLGVPSAAGGGASGVWSIDVSGNAATVTDGVYTTGTYADPSWITAISGAKVLGNIAGSAAGFTGTLAGDVTGTQGATTVAGIQGTTVSNVAPLDGQVLKYNDASGKWEPGTDNGGGGTVTAVTASGPLSSSGGTTPNISLSGTVAIASGGTGAGTAAGARSNLGVPSTTGGGASGVWGIDITGNAANVTGIVEIANGGTGATTQAGAQANLNVPSTSGVGASGVWNIDVNGNAATVSNGVYTTGSYADPSWIASIAGAKISGNIPGNAANVTGTVGIANGGTGAGTAAGARSNLGVPSTTGGGASGVWNIDVNGNAATVTDGVYATGTYADPSWITSIAGAKVLGNISGNAATATALAANGVNCPAGQYPLGVDAQGNAEGCTAASTGTVTSVVTGAGLTGGPITTTGTISVPNNGITGAMIADGTITFADWASNACVNGQVPKYNGSAWTCAADNNTTYAPGAGISIGGGTISVAADGITGGMILDGTVTFADWNRNGCNTNQIPTWDGAGWVCGDPTTGAITGVTAGTGLTGGGSSGNVTLNADTTYLQRRVANPCAGGKAIQGINEDGTVACADISGGGGGGTVTQVNTGAGLTGGPITGTGTLSIANGGVTNAMLANAGVTVAAGTGLSGGGAVALGGTTTLNLSAPVSVANGGTGAGTAAGARTNLGVPSATGGGASGVWGIDISGNAATVTDGLYSTGTYADPSWITAVSGAKVLGNIAGSAGGFTGTLAGDVTGTQGATTVAGIRGTSVSSTAPVDGQVLKYNGVSGKWEPAADSNSGGTVTSVTASGPLASSGGSTPNISLSGTVGIASGGTGAGTAAGARTNLGVPSTTGGGASGSWGIDITGNAANVTGTVGIANGGTGAGTAAGARSNLDVPSTTGSGAAGVWNIDVNGNAATVSNGVYTTGSYADPSWISSIAGAKISGNITGNAANVTGTVGVANGGTGAGTAAGARTNLGVPSTTGGGASGVWGIDVSGNAGTVTNGVYTTGSYADPSWISSIAGAKISGNITGNAANVTGTVGVANGGTGISNYTTGDLIYASNATTLSKLPDVATGNALISGGAGAAPSWGKVDLTTHVSGTLPIANGGTNGTAAPTSGTVAYGTGSAYAFTAAGTANQVLTSQGAGAPTFQTIGGMSIPLFQQPNGVNWGSGVTRYPAGAILSNSEAATEIAMPKCVVKRVRIYALANGWSQNGTITVRRNGAGTALTGTVLAGATGGISITGSAAFNDGDTLAIQLVGPAGGGNLSLASVSVTADPL